MARRQNAAPMAILVLFLAVSQAHGRAWAFRDTSVITRTPHGHSVSSVSVGGSGSGSSHASASVGLSVGNRNTATEYSSGSRFGTSRISSRTVPRSTVWRSSGPSRTSGGSSLVMDKSSQGHQFPSVPTSSRSPTRITSHASASSSYSGRSSVHTRGHASTSSSHRSSIRTSFTHDLH